ncbi:helix-turn-helix transcriptional regulator [Pedobacter sp. HDW13]|uniref:helix-turn-helix domain-containing protein n=1 Tax=Pedobacter sp. HDW13 TaxID=2714940 RepID=UPI0014093E53|nr:helix-turn-helix domain-containing protein [Pedobacter sp. HDW13]QIL41201.1 helix-turn-helix transcriptional regulator [Pedobacter sp. HDW13]
MKAFFPYKNINLNRGSEFYESLLSKIPENRYWFYICILFNANVINIIEKVGFSKGGFTILNTLWSPLWLLLGPLCFLANNSLSNNKKNSMGLIHLLPGGVYVVFYIVVKLDQASHSAIAGELNEMYWISMFLVPASLIFYSICVIVDRTRDLTKLGYESELVIMISCFYLIIALLYFLVGYCWLVLDIELKINYRFLIYGLLSITVAFIAIYFLMVKKNRNLSRVYRFQVSQDGYSNSKLKSEQINEYKERIKKHFDGSKCFLRSNFSLEILSRELDIPQHNLSQVFNLYLGKNFYGYIAEYRIEYALTQLRSNNGKLKMESLAYQCGFNSRSSFIRYFKEITGYVPSEYCQKMKLNNFCS